MLLREVRLVPVRTPAVPDHPVDLRVRDGVVAEVASRLDREPGEELVEAGGRWLVPGLWDAHVHLTQWALGLTRLDLAGTASPEEVTAAVARHVAATPGETGTVVGYGHRSGTWRRWPTVAELDAVAGGRAVVLVSGDAHHGWLSSEALRLLGLPPREGPLEEDDWFPVYARLRELPGPEVDDLAVHRAAVEGAVARGVVGIVDLEFSRPWAEWPERVAAGVDGIRVRTGVYPDELDEVLRAGWCTGEPLPGGAGLITMGPFKVISDGSLNTRTAYCCEPYADARELPAPRGRQNHTREQLEELLTAARNGGLEAAVHAIGDAAVTSALDAFESTRARGSVEHAQLVRRDDLRRMARLGLRASVQPAHLLDDRDVTARCWPDRMDRCFLLRSMLDAGVQLALGSDAPVSPLDPWGSMAAAVHRSADDREPWNPGEALTAAEALAASTDGRGTPTPGAPADLVLLDADPLAGHDTTRAVAAHLRSMRVALTVVAGRVRHTSF
ncbi:amidohydrolase [Nocardioides caldifontis]|uniref:amidohydrolase n=1 Tax=Nocardioides caldifontis TaxID=2588938 RepID=UPI0011E00810|nr:amidohydrolase family protein [Nocardioides caldifontis]